MNKEEFIGAVTALGIDVNDSILMKLDLYYKLLIEWNEKINLTAITEENDVYLKHFYDSLTICRVIDLKNEEILCDIGTGAGFPGVVLKIFFPHLKLTLVDALNKRINFLNLVCEKLEFDNTKCIHARAEEYAVKNREMFDVVTARAVASLNVLLEYSIPLVKVNKYFVAMKANEDLEASTHAVKVLNCSIDKIDSFMLPIENSNRMLIRIKKNSLTNMKYPRKFADIKKKPL